MQEKQQISKNMESKSISELDGWKWDDEIPTPDYGGGIATRFYKLHKVPITELEIQDIRFLIVQKAALQYLVPIAIDKIRNDIFVDTEYYPGDLLQSLFEIVDKGSFWNDNPLLKAELLNLYLQQQSNLENLELTKELKVNLQSLFERFQKG